MRAAAASVGRAFVLNTAQNSAVLKYSMALYPLGSPLVPSISGWSWGLWAGNVG